VGYIHADVGLTNYYAGRTVAVRALIDTGTTEVFVTDQIASELGFDLEAVDAGRLTGAQRLPCFQLLPGDSQSSDA
jgi:predicted aspartyl protease